MKAPAFGRVKMPSKFSTKMPTKFSTKMPTKAPRIKVGRFDVRPMVSRGTTRAVKRISPPATGWKLGPVSIGKTQVVVEPVGNQRRRTFVAAGAGWVIAYLLDPTMGRTRRAKLASRTAGVIRRTVRRGARTGRRIEATAEGLAERAKHLREEPKDLNDPTLQQKIKSQVLRSDKVGISVDVTSGVVTLRGTCEEPSDIRAIERAVRKTEGVRDVINLLHAPGTPAPNVQDSLRAT